jgi:thiamine-phosphate pyrophosphorylase
MGNSKHVRQRLRDALRLYVLTDHVLAGHRGDREVVEAAIAGGATAIQLRWKPGPLSKAVSVGRALRTLCRESGVLFVVNDRVDLALALDADGVHLGVDDLPVPEARAIADDRIIIGYSPATFADALAAERAGADYLGVGPIYGTATKSDAGDAVGIDYLTRIVRAVSIPVVAVGGISADNAGPVVEAGAAGVAVISAVVSALDVRAAAQALRSVVEDTMIEVGR